ncbi:MAG TPA: hypothetical protein VNV63_03405 [Nitrospiria bacterium]|nr:hypothetical protein [Nitrospiria bacterium]
MIKKILLVLLVGIIFHAGYQVLKYYKVSEGFSDDLDTLMLTVRGQTEESFKQEVIARAEKNGIHLTPEEVSVRIEDTAASSFGSRVLGGTGAAVHNKRITLDFEYHIPIYGIPLTHPVHRTKIFAAEIGSPSSLQEEQIKQVE